MEDYIMNTTRGSIDSVPRRWNTFGSNRLGRDYQDLEGQEEDRGASNNNGALGTGIEVIKSLLARLLFVVHSVLVVWRLVDVKNNEQVRTGKKNTSSVT